MESKELRNLQAPLKERYRALPESAIVTLKTDGKVGNGISCKVETGKTIIEAGLHTATGGNGLLVCSGDLLLEALVACAGVTLSAVATAIGVTLKEGVIKAEGELDFRGTLGVSKDVPVGFKTLHLNFYLDADATEEQLQSLAKLTKRYCVVYQTLIQGVSVQTSFNKKV